MPVATWEHFLQTSHIDFNTAYTDAVRSHTSGVLTLGKVPHVDPLPHFSRKSKLVQ